MGRLDALAHIARDTDLKEEILTRIHADTDVGARVGAAARAGTDGRPVAAPTWRTDRPVTADRARRAMEAPSASRDEPGLEAIILLLGRPVLLVRDDDIDLTQVETDTWTSRLEQARSNLRAAIRSVGRIDVDNNPQFDWVGTGWVVADDVVVTNRHVASLFAHDAGARFVFRTSFLGQMGARLDFHEELGSRSPAEFRIVEVLHIEDDAGPDMALLRIDWAGSDASQRRTPIALAAGAARARSVAVIGYPAKDTRTRIPDEMDRIFGDVYNVKRLAPGEVTGTVDRDRLVTHDCTTLGGNSGSVVVDLETGEAAALHFAGRERDRNYAVAAAVVRARLEQVLGTRSVPGPRIVIDPGSNGGAPTLADLQKRSGYDPAFLGPTVGHPALARHLEDALAPVLGREDGILDYTHYSVRMHRFRRLAMYTAVNIDGRNVRNVRRGRDRWSIDPRIEPQFQVGNELYQRNKLDRGHLVRRLDPAWGATFEDAEAAAEDTFFYTNCAPQHKGLNQDLWLGLEDHILSNAQVHDLKVSVFTGPVFRDSDRAYRSFLIPEDFWKIVAIVNDTTGQLSVTGYMLSQRDFMDDLEFAFGTYRTYQVPVTTVEDQTRLDFGTLRDCDPLRGMESVAFRPLTTPDDITL